MNRKHTEHEGQPLRLERMQRKLHGVERGVRQQALEQPKVRDQNARDDEASGEVGAGEGEHDARRGGGRRPVPRAQATTLEQVGRECNHCQQQASRRKHVHWRSEKQREDCWPAARIRPPPGFRHRRADQCARGDQQRQEHAGGYGQLAPRYPRAAPFLDGHGDDEHRAGEHHEGERDGGAAIPRPQCGKRRRVDLRVEQGAPIRVGDEKPIELRRLPGALVAPPQRHRNEAGGQRDGARGGGAAAFGHAQDALDGDAADTSRRGLASFSRGSA